MANDSVRAVGIDAGQIASARFSPGPENYGAFSGAQITAHVNNVSIGTLTSVNWTVHSEKVAQYTFGSANPRQFVTGKRGIAGSMTYNTFDRSALLSVFAGNNGTGQPLVNYIGNNNASEFTTEFQNYSSNGTSLPGLWQPLGTKVYQSIPNATQQFNTTLQNNLVDAYANAFSVPLEYTDQLPPFDLTLTMVNAQGKAAYMVIGGIEIINEGGGYNIDDMITQTAYTYVARYMRPLTPVTSAGAAITDGAIPQVSVPAAGMQI